jgi:3-oxoadipate enol-lactonase
MKDITTTAPTRYFIDGPAGKLSYLEWSGDRSATPLVFAHPVNSAAAVWDQVAPLLTAGRAAYAIDYRGHGGSSPGGPYLAQDYAQDTLAMMDAASLDSVHFIGGSIGGAVSLEVASKALWRISSITLFGASFGFGMPEAELAEMIEALRAHGVEEWFRLHACEVIGSQSVPGVVERLVGLAGGREVETVADILAGAFSLSDSFPAARELVEAGPPPSKVITGAEDPTCPPEMAAVLASYLDTEPLLMEGIGHLPMLEAPERTAALIEESISSADA